MQTTPSPLRSHRPAALLFTLATALLSEGLTPAQSSACAFFGQTTRNQEPPARFGGEKALIVWDEATHTEHFVRRAEFQAVNTDLAFLVPTPTEPRLREVNDSIWNDLSNLLPPTCRSRATARSAGGPPEAGAIGGSGAPQRPAVQVHQRLVIAGQDAVVLSGTDGAAIEAWLNRHRFHVPTEIRSWIQHYAEKSYFITAFRLRRGRNRTFATRSVQMTFQSERAFYPYLEPNLPNASADGREFRLFVLGANTLQARMGAQAWMQEPRIVSLIRSGETPSAVRSSLERSLQLQGGSLLNRFAIFQEYGARQSSEDLFFEDAALPAGLTCWDGAR